MLIHFQALAEHVHVRQLASHRARIEALGRDIAEVSLRSFSSWLKEFDPRLSCEALRSTERWIITCRERGAIPLAEWLVTQLHGRSIAVGRPPGTVEEARIAALGVGVDLSSSRVRVGFARGHLLEIYVLVPLDVRGAMEQLQLAAEVYLETLLGDRLLDDWVDQVAVDRIARTKGLMMAADAKSQAQNYPLSEVGKLVETGVAALRRSLPLSHLSSLDAEDAWAALELSEVDVGQVDVAKLDRLYASTCHPEALKACLAGSSFCSQRFTRGEEIFTYLRWRGPKGAQRQRLRDVVERCVVQSRGSEPDWVLAGTGFGRDFDYLDLWVRPQPDVLLRLMRCVGETTGNAELGFYDSKWSSEALSYAELEPE